MTKPKAYAIGSDHIPGLGKVVEETGELNTVLGKIIGLGEIGDHWDGQDLRVSLLEELTDVRAATDFFMEVNGYPAPTAWMQARYADKLAKFREWHANQQSSGLEDVMAEMRRNEEMQSLRTQNNGLKQIIACAICATCSDQIGDEDFDTDDDGNLIHKRCAPEEE